MHPNGDRDTDTGFNPMPFPGVPAGGGLEPVGPVAAAHLCGRWTIIPTMSHTLFQMSPSMASPSI